MVEDISKPLEDVMDRLQNPDKSSQCGVEYRRHNVNSFMLVEAKNKPLSQVVTFRKELKANF